MREIRGGARNLPTEGLDLPTGGAEMALKCGFRTSFCQISSEKKPKIPPIGGLDAPNRGL